jgi:signal transduction histidine kinase
MKRRPLIIPVISLVIFVLAQACFAQPLSLVLVKQKVKAASELIETEGEAAFDKLKDPNGEFRFCGGKGYVWVHSLSGVMLMHPVQPDLVGRNMADYQDSEGFLFIVAMNKLVKKYGGGWVVYFWPKPGSRKDSLKGSFVQLVKNSGKDYIVGCGMYEVSKEYIKSVFPQDIVCDSELFKTGF